MNPVKLKEGQQPPYQDPKTSKIDDWVWHPMDRIRQELSARRELPEHVGPYADYMREMNAKAQSGELTPRDLVKAYTITQSSIGRGGLSHATATKRGMKLPNTGGEVRPEGAFAEWLGSPMGQKYLEAAMRGEEHPEALEDLRTKFAPFGKQHEQVEAMKYATQNAPTLAEKLNEAITGPKDAFRKYTNDIRGIASAKSGFIGSLLGRGDQPTLDARQIDLHSLYHPTKEPESMMSRGKGLGGREAVDRLTARQEALGYNIPKELTPYAQHLIHHDVWDQRGRDGGTKTTHKDLIKAMLGYADGGDVVNLKKGGEPSVEEMAADLQAGYLKGTKTKPHPAAGTRFDVDAPYGLAPKTPIDLERHKGDSVALMPWDSTSRNVTIRGISGHQLPQPVVTHGGHDFGRDIGHMERGLVGASNLAIAKRIADRDRIARMENEKMGGTGRVLHLPTTMGRFSEGFSLTPAELAYQLHARANLPGEHTDELEALIRNHLGGKHFGGFAGLRDPEAYANQIRTGEGLANPKMAGELRKLINMKLIHGKRAQELMDFNAEDAEQSMIDPALRGVRKAHVGNAVLTGGPDRMELSPSDSTRDPYDTRFSGEYLGSLGHSVPFEALFGAKIPKLEEEFHFKPRKKGIAGPLQLNTGNMRNMVVGALEKRKFKVAQMLDNQTLDQYGKYLLDRDRMLKKGKYAKGGPVSQDEMLAHTILAKKKVGLTGVKNIGADEAPDMKIKAFAPPGPGKMPAGGVDFQPDMPGQQLAKAAPPAAAGSGAPGMPPGGPGTPPGGAPGMPPGMPPGGAPGMQLPPPLPRNQPGMPTGKPAGVQPPMEPVPKQKPVGSNILAMTRQGQALAAMKHMAKGGAVKEDRSFKEATEPTKTTKAYKLFRVHPKHPGKLFPLFVDPNVPVTMDKWLAAQPGEMSGKKVKSKIGPLAYRPGWHGGDLPIATHIGDYTDEQLMDRARVNALRSKVMQERGIEPAGDTHAKHREAINKEFAYPESAVNPTRRSSSHVWAEVDMPNDVDWQTEADRRGTNAKGKLVPVNAHITDQVPGGGHYRYKTNANMTGNWLIGGAMKVKKVLSDKEVNAINRKAGVADLPRNAPMDLGAHGFGEPKKMAEGGSVTGPEGIDIHIPTPAPADASGGAAPDTGALNTQPSAPSTPMAPGTATLADAPSLGNITGADPAGQAPNWSDNDKWLGAPEYGPPGSVQSPAKGDSSTVGSYRKGGQVTLSVSQRHALHSGYTRQHKVTPPLSITQMRHALSARRSNSKA